MIILIGSSLDKIGVGIGSWYANKTKNPIHEPYSAMGFLDQLGYIQGAAIFNNYNGANIEMHYYGPKCVTRMNFKAVLTYVFNELGCIRITVLPPRNNKKLLKILPRLNFVYETVLKNYYGSKKQDDAIVYRMTPIEASKWIKLDGNKFDTQTASGSSSFGNCYSGN